ncbi:MAG TPA: glycosyltransferase, partial [Solirubrobacteraceae bacterium]|nr:glycosyltransferase [Solirubrobacteraceae bacterium]
VPAAGWLDAIEAAVVRGADLVGGPIEWRTGAAPSRVARFDALWRLDAEAAIAEGWTGSGNLAIRRDVFERLGGFDATLVHAGEDVDLCRRATASGARLAFAPDARVAHAAERKATGLVRRAFRQGYGNAQLRRRYGAQAGRAYWRHPKPLVAGDWALERFGIEDRELLGIARLDYAGRVAGSLWADLRRAR